MNECNGKTESEMKNLFGKSVEKKGRKDDSESKRSNENIRIRCERGCRCLCGIFFLSGI